MVDNLGAIGQIKDLQPYQLPPNAWSDLTNIRCKDGQIGTFLGHDDLATPSITPYYLWPVASKTSFYWAYLGGESVYAFNGVTHTDITRSSGSYIGGATDQWNCCAIYGIPVFNNGADDPQMWNPVDTSTVLTKLTGWDSTWKAKVIRSFKDALFAFYTTESGIEYPHRVRFSATGGGSIPTDWDDTSTTNDAGKTPLADTPGALVDALILDDTFMIYKEDAVYGCQYVGGQSIYRFYRISKLPGALAQDCMVGFPGGHFVVGSDDVYIHNGQVPVSVIDDKNRDFLFSEIDDDSYASTYVTLNQSESEIWICYPESGESFPNKALVWNYLDNTWYPRDLPTGTAFISPGPLITSTYSWDTIPHSSWEDWTGVWGARSYSNVSKTLVGVTTGTKLYKFDNGNQFDGVDASCIAERTGLDLGPGTHTINAIYFNAEGDPFNVYVGSQEFPQDTVTWEGPYEFDPSTDRKIDCRVTGWLHAIKLQSEDDVSWFVGSYTPDFVFAGER